MSIFEYSGYSDITSWVRTLPRPLVFTNGCFDILHIGHVSYLQAAAKLGSALVVGVNSDESVRTLGKGADRPINPLGDRMGIISALSAVSGVVSFDAPTPLDIILQIRPDHLVKGGDWSVDDIVGADEVRAWGGEVHSIAFEHERSTTHLLERIRSD